jgi:hypothetical protein
LFIHQVFGRANLAFCVRVLCGKEIRVMFDQQAQQFGGWQQQAQEQGQQTIRPLRL